MLGNLIGGFVIILVGVNLVPLVANSVYGVQGAGNSSTVNVTGASSTIIGLTTIFFALGVMAAGISVGINGLKQAGVL